MCHQDTSVYIYKYVCIYACAYTHIVPQDIPKEPKWTDYGPAPSPPEPTNTMKSMSKAHVDYKNMNNKLTKPQTMAQPLPPSAP